jgi:hypothetical protein
MIVCEDSQVFMDIRETGYADKFDVEMTCIACPEQYDVYDKEGNQVAYFRLRFGAFRVQHPDAGGEIVYTASIGDGWTGSFATNSERIRHFRRAFAAIEVAIEETENRWDD